MPQLKPATFKTVRERATEALAALRARKVTVPAPREDAKPELPTVVAVDVPAHHRPHLVDGLEGAGGAPAVTLDTFVLNIADPEARAWFKDRRNARQVPRRMEAAGYVPVRNPDALDGLWKVGKARKVIYTRADLSPPERQAAAAEVVRSGRDRAGQ